VRPALVWAAGLLSELGDAWITAEALLGHVLGATRAWLLAHPEAELGASQRAVYSHLIARAEAGEPLAYLTGRREFFGLDFLVTPDVLVPRPETEQLVELALSLRPAPRHILDVGTGTGCIAVALAVHLRGAQVVAVDISPAALAVAQQNAEAHGVADRLTLAESDLLVALLPPEATPEAVPAALGALGPPPPLFDLICANLPYVDQRELPSLAVSRHEPRIALDGGRGGLALIERLLAQVARAGCLGAGGRLLLEIGDRQGQAAAGLARLHFPRADVRVYADHAGLDRVLEVGPRA
jgi:release factor glutamine methyltransferase